MDTITHDEVTRYEINAFHVAVMQLIRGLAKVPAPRVDVTPTPQQIEDVGRFITDVAKLGDAFMLDVGKELKANAPTAIDLKNFKTPFFDAVDGYALWDVRTVALELQAQEEDEF